MSCCLTSRLSATTARAPPGPTNFPRVTKRRMISNSAVLIDLDITRVRDNYKTGERTVFGGEIVIRQAHAIRAQRDILRERTEERATNHFPAQGNPVFAANGNPTCVERPSWDRVWRLPITKLSLKRIIFAWTTTTVSKVYNKSYLIDLIDFWRRGRDSNPRNS